MNGMLTIAGAIIVLSGIYQNGYSDSLETHRNASFISIIGWTLMGLSFLLFG